jgi:F-type H+-transporting ATPase subunit gamma
MAQTLRELKRRIKSVKNTRQLTKAMELVATSRMRRAIEAAGATRDYAKTAWEIVKSVSRGVSEKEHPLLQKKTEVQNVCFLILSTNRGLCGNLNNQLVAKVLPYLKTNKKISFVTWGRKGREFIRRFSNELLADFERSDKLGIVSEARSVAKFLTSIFLEGKADEIWLVYSDFVSTLKQEPALLRILPLKYKSAEGTGQLNPASPPPLEKEEKTADYTYLFEPETFMVLEAMLPRIIELELYHAYLESYASEQAARMIAMRNATDNASGLLDELTLIYNQARQAGITKELSEISAVRAVLE